MKKVGIITFHNALSYGAALQSYALQKFLDANGVDNDIIDYECDYINKRYKKLLNIDKRNIPKSLAGSVLRAGNKKLNLKLSREFRQKHMRLSPSYNKSTIASCADKYSGFISGSDQVWSPTCAGFDTAYLLDFAKPGQKFSYAASFGVPVIPKEKEPEYKKLLKDFSLISLREQSGEDIVKSVTDKETCVNIDPTLLLKSSQWDKLACNIELKKPYILLFGVLKPKNMVQYAVKLGKEKNLPVYNLTDLHFPKIDGINYIKPVSPDMFIGLIKNAEYVVTNSFHGSAFSIIYHKKFVMELDSYSKRNTRSEELLKMLGIENKEITKDCSPDPDLPVDWVKADEILEAEREKSRLYVRKIKDAIEKAR